MSSESGLKEKQCAQSKLIIEIHGCSLQLVTATYFHTWNMKRVDFRLKLHFISAVDEFWQVVQVKMLLKWKKICRTGETLHVLLLVHHLLLRKYCRPPSWILKDYSLTQRKWKRRMTEENSCKRLWKFTETHGKFRLNRYTPNIPIFVSFSKTYRDICILIIPHTSNADSWKFGTKSQWLLGFRP